MSLNFFQRRKILKGRNYFELVPVIKVKYELTEDNIVRLIIPKFKNENFATWFIPKRKSLHIKIDLDKIGSTTWIEIDGKKNVRQICEQLNMKYDNNLPQVEERVTKYFTKLYEQRYISFTILEENKLSF